ncbi:MAG: hypothetical protein JWL61_5439 [Gemmatimonadetes bacterium]|nr:hypothetical protein [Gemmatimonadota bacterium]
MLILAGVEESGSALSRELTGRDGSEIIVSECVPPLMADDCDEHAMRRATGFICHLPNVAVHERNVVHAEALAFIRPPEERMALAPLDDVVPGALESEAGGDAVASDVATGTAMAARGGGHDAISRSVR